MTNAFHHCPVVEQKDISDSPTSVVVQKAICMIANLMRQDPIGPKLAGELYERVKILICTNSEPDPVHTLETLCLLSLWSNKPSNPVSLDSPGHWIGVATRLALQIGLHREATYLNRSDASCLRRIFWSLHVCRSLPINGHSNVEHRTAIASTSLAGAYLHYFGARSLTSSCPHWMISKSRTNRRKFS